RRTLRRLYHLELPICAALHHFVFIAYRTTNKNKYGHLHLLNMWKSTIPFIIDKADNIVQVTTK
ncbi:hypothetical protein P3550_24590, partial [Vibrio parahaemolyticus]|nr:hypothetical protein [Vibrio parahaemolyticus]